MSKEHYYELTLDWTGNIGSGTKEYASYERSHLINVNNKKIIEASSDSSFRGDPSNIILKNFC